MTVCAIVISYHPNEEIIENVTALLNQVDEIVIVDNGSGAETKQLLDRLSRYSKVSITFLQDNLGIAAALNIGIRQAKAHGHQWALTLDQDSHVTDGMIVTMLRAYEAHPQKEKVASLSPRFKNKNTKVIRGSQLINNEAGLLYAETQEVITSGNLLRLSIFDSLGYFDESLFIDYVDIEYCLRCVSKGYTILEAKEAVLVHDIGFPVQHRFLWMRPTATNHSALRRYYFARNAIYVYRNYLFKQPAWVIQNAVILAKTFAVIALFEKNRMKKINAFIRGLADGLRNRMGRCSISI